MSASPLGSYNVHCLDSLNGLIIIVFISYRCFDSHHCCDCPGDRSVDSHRRTCLFKEVRTHYLKFTIHDLSVDVCKKKSIS